jgi:putative endonuclease
MREISSKKLGNLGEKIAVKYLKKQGYKVLDRNFRYKGYGEIDIIAKKEENLHFVEVKTRLRVAEARYDEAKARENIGDIYAPEDNITYFKKRQLIKLSKIYLVKNPPTGKSDVPWQIDVIAVELNHLTKRTKVRYIEQAVEDFN